MRKKSNRFMGVTQYVDSATPRDLPLKPSEKFLLRLAGLVLVIGNAEL